MSIFGKMKSAMSLIGMYRSASRWAKSRTTQNVSAAGGIVLFVLLAIRHFAPQLLPWDADQDQTLTESAIVVGTIVGSRWIAMARHPEKFDGTTARVPVELQGMDPLSDADLAARVDSWKKNDDVFIHRPAGSHCQTLQSALDFGASTIWLVDGRIYDRETGWVKE